MTRATARSFRPRRPRASRLPLTERAGEALTERVRRRSAKLSKGQRKVVEFLLGDCDRAVFLASRQVAEELSVSEATVVRTARALGFSGYPELRTALRSYLLARKSAVVAPSATVSNAPWTPRVRSIAEVLADFVLDYVGGDLPEAHAQRVKLHVLDTLAVGLAGSRAASSQPVSRVALAAAGKPEATVFGVGRATSAPDAALANGAAAHALELDDDHRTATLHPGAVVVPAALAAAEAVGAPGGKFLGAVLLGYEVMCRVGEAFLGRQYQRGFHPTGTCGVFGSAVAAGVVLGLDREGLVAALGIAGTQASGLAEWRVGGSWIKRLHPGRAAQSGLLAARLAAEGFTGPATIFEGPGGFLQAFASEGAVDLEALTRKLGSEFRFMATAVKPYPCSRPSHGAIDLALDAVRQGAVPSAIQSVRIEICRTSLLTYTKRPATTVDAQFSLPYLVAAALVRGRVGLAELSDTAIRDPAILAVADRVTVKENPAFTAQYPRRYPVDLLLTLSRGRTRRAFSDCPRGDPEAPEYQEHPDHFRQAVEDKARTLLAETGFGDRVEGFIRAVHALPDASSVEALAEWLK
jgi:2-methylcitrate dehydratase PrpD